MCLNKFKKTFLFQMDLYIRNIFHLGLPRQNIRQFEISNSLIFRILRIVNDPEVFLLSIIDQL